jgi:RNA polymerase sigma-70 factor (TIGR02960 family)
MDEAALLEQARNGDDAAFGRLVAPYHGELHAHCYRMLGSLHDADDALQNALLGAWRGLAGFEGRSSMRSWLYRIATNAAIRIGRGRTRVLSTDYAPSVTDPQELGEPVLEPIWLEPYPEALLGSAGPVDPAARYDVRESVEIALVAALQHLPATQRAVLILRDVLAFSAAEVAGLLDTTVPSVNSALQRARAGVGRRTDARTQQRTVAALGDERTQELLASLMAAWESADVPAILGLLVDDAVMSMPPLPAWFDGRDAIGRFMRERMFETPWRVRPATVNGQLALACYQQVDGAYRLAGLTAVTLAPEGIAALTSFLVPMLDERFELPQILSAEPMRQRPAVTPER